MSTSLQTIPENSPNELGPFGRLFVGEFPSRGTLSLIAVGALFSSIIAGGWLSFLLLLIIMSYLSIYMSYNYIEPHFNSKVGIVRQKKLDSIASKGHLAMSDIGNMLHGYGKSAAGQVWDLSGEINLSSLFERIKTLLDLFIVFSPNLLHILQSSSRKISYFSFIVKVQAQRINAISIPSRLRTIFKEMS